MHVVEFDPLAFFRAIDASGVRALLIGRQALIALGLPVLTADYDFWIPADEAAAFNAALQDFDFVPNRAPEQARAVGRYVLENSERVDVLVAASVTTVDQVRVRFDEVWSRRQVIDLGDGARVCLPSISDLMLTKRFASRPKDAEDLRLLQVLASKEKP